jgi:hypothetical protein
MLCSTRGNTQRRSASDHPGTSTALTLSRTRGAGRPHHDAPTDLKYEHGLIVAEGDYVIVPGRFSGHGRPEKLDRPDIPRLKIAFSRSIGVWSRTNREAKLEKAVFGCSGIRFPASGIPSFFEVPRNKRIKMAGNLSEKNRKVGMIRAQVHDVR